MNTRNFSLVSTVFAYVYSTFGLMCHTSNTRDLSVYDFIDNSNG